MSEEIKIEKDEKTVSGDKNEAGAEKTAASEKTAVSDVKALGDTIKRADDKADNKQDKETDDDIDCMTVAELEMSEGKSAKAALNNADEDKPKKKKGNKFFKFLKKHIKLLIFLIILIIAAIVVMQHMKKKSEQALLEAANSQEYDLIKRDDITSAISTTGTIKSKKVSTLYSAFQGTATKITNVNYEVGDHVNEGDVVVTFSTENIEKKISQSEEDIATSKQKEALNAESRERTYLNTYSTESYSLSSAQEKVDTTLKALYEACSAYGDAKRALQEAKDDDDTTDAEIATLEQSVSKAYQTEQSAQTSYQDAVAALAEANRKATNDLASAQTTYDTGALTAGDDTKKLERQLEEYEDSLDDYIVTAPISGVVTKVEVEEGNNFTSGNLMVIQQDDSFIITTEIDEYDVPSVSEGQKVIVKTDATRDDELEGIVSFVSPTASSATGGVTQAASSNVTYTVEIDLLTKDDRIRLGMSAKINIITEEHNDTLVVRYDAIEEDSNGDNVIYVVDNSKPAGSADADNAASEGDDGILVVGPDGKEKNSEEKGGFNVSFGGDNSGFLGMNNKSNAKDGNAMQNAGQSGRKIKVETGIEGDYYVEIISDEIAEGMQVLVNANNGEGGDAFNQMMGGFMGGGGGGGMGGGGGGGPR